MSRCQPLCEPAAAASSASRSAIGAEACSTPWIDRIGRGPHWSAHTPDCLAGTSADRPAFQGQSCAGTGSVHLPRCGQRPRQDHPHHKPPEIGRYHQERMVHLSILKASLQILEYWQHVFIAILDSIFQYEKDCCDGPDFDAAETAGTRRHRNLARTAEISRTSCEGKSRTKAKTDRCGKGTVSANAPISSEAKTSRSAEATETSVRHVFSLKKQRARWHPAPFCNSASRSRYDPQM